MNRDPEVTAAALTDVAYFVEDDDGNLQTVYDGEVIHAELVDEPMPDPWGEDTIRPANKPAPIPPYGTPEWVQAGRPMHPRKDLTQWLPKVPELNPRLRTPDEATPIFDELDSRRGRKSWTKTMHKLVVARLREQEQYHLEEGGHRDRVWEIEHASEVLNAIDARA